MKLTPEKQQLYKALREFRNTIFDKNCYYNNDVLEDIAINRPKTKGELLKLDSSEEKCERFGESFLAIVKFPENEPGKLSCADNRSLIGIRKLEINLYLLVKLVLQKEYKSSWWFDGVPEEVRTKASVLHEESKGVVPREYGLMFGNLKKIIQKNWRLFDFITKLTKETKKSFGDSMDRLNEVRNRLCHPLRLLVQPITEEDVNLIDKNLSLIEKLSTYIRNEDNESYFIL